MIPQAIATQVGKVRFRATAKAPEILFVTGVAGVLASTVAACRATLKTQETLADLAYEVNEAKGLHQDPDSERSREEYIRDLTYVYGKNVTRIAVQYAPAIIGMGVSIACLTKSHSILQARNDALAIAYMGIQESYQQYRDRVRAEVGEEKEAEIYYGGRSELVVTDDGEEITIRVVNPDNLTPYARFFDESCKNHTSDPEQNRFFLLCQQNYFNHRLTANGIVFLNEVYTALGLPISQEGQVVGWATGEGSTGDDFIDFGIFDPGNSRFVNGVEQSVLLDFNVNGVVSHLI